MLYWIKWQTRGGCREIDSSKQGQARLLRVTPAPKFILKKKKKMANDSHLSPHSML